MSLDCCFEQIGETGVLSFTGSLTARNAGDLHAALLLALSNAHWIVINLDLVTETDATGLHHLCRAVGDSTCGKKILLLAGRHLMTLQRRIANGELSCSGACRLAERDCVFHAPSTNPPLQEERAQAGRGPW